MKFFRDVSFVLILFLFCSNCGYRLVGYGTALPAHIHTIAIPVFKNTSPEPNIHRDATDAIRRAFISDGRLKVVGTSKADLLMRGTLTDYQLRAVSFSAEDTVEEYIVRLGVQVESYDQVKKKIFFRQKFTTQWDYRTTSSVVDSESARFTALKEAYDDLAGRLVSTTIEQF